MRSLTLKFRGGLYVLEGNDCTEKHAGELCSGSNILGNEYNNDDHVRPSEWHFVEREVVLGPNSIMGIITHMQSSAVEIETADGPLWYRWYDIVKYYELGDYVEVVEGELRGRHGFVQGVDDASFIDIMEGHSSKGQRDMVVHRNLARIISPPTMSISFVLSPEEMAKRMHTGTVPWQGLRILVLPSTVQSKKRRFDQLEKPSNLGREADVHKGKIGTVLDIGINQATASGLSVCVRLEQNYRAVHAYQDIWVDYDEVVEEITGLPLRFYQPLHHSQRAFLPSHEYHRMRIEEDNVAHGQLLAAQVALRLRRTSPPPPRSITPPHDGPSEDLGSGNAWDVKAPEPPTPKRSHWSRHPALAERELRVNVPDKSQPQKVRLDLSGDGCIMKLIFQTTVTDVHNVMGVTPLEPTVRNFHRWMVIYGPHIGKYVRGIRYVQGSKPVLWTVQEITLAENEHDSLVGEEFNVHNTDLCQVADSQQTLDINNQWAQSIHKAPTKLKKRKT